MFLENSFDSIKYKIRANFNVALSRILRDYNVHMNCKIIHKGNLIISSL